jgi:hypothetical protein
MCTITRMYISRRGEKATIRNTRRNLWHTSWSKNNGKKNIPSGILLAISPKWQKRNRQILS